MQQLFFEKSPFAEGMAKTNIIFLDLGFDILAVLQIDQGNGRFTWLFELYDPLPSSPFLKKFDVHLDSGLITTSRNKSNVI